MLVIARAEYVAGEMVGSTQPLRGVDRVRRSAGLMLGNGFRVKELGLQGKPGACLVTVGHRDSPQSVLVPQ